jgi:hypothetical protein
MSKITRFASSAGMGIGKESTEGGGETRGEVGLDDALLTKRRLLDFFSAFDEEEDTVILRSGARDDGAEVAEAW